MSNGSDWPPGRVVRWIAGSCLAVAGALAWVQMMQAAGRGLSFEANSDAAIARAAAARPVGIAWSLALMGLAVALALVTRHRALAFLGLPGLGVLLTCLGDIGNGGALFAGLLLSGVAALLTVSLETRQARRARVARGPLVDGPQAGPTA